MMARWVEIHEVPDAVKHDYWVGRPLWMATIYERQPNGSKHIHDVETGDSRDEVAAWARDKYALKVE